MLCFPIICKEENVGTGTFRITNINNNEISLEKLNKNKIFIIKVYENISDLYNAFVNEEIDIFTSPNVNYEKYIGGIGYNKTRIYGRKFDYLKFNLNNTILSNIEVLQAIDYAINKNEIIYKVYNNIYYPAEFPLQYGSYLYNNNIKHEYNTSKAHNILEETGWKYNRNLLGKRWTNYKYTTINK